MPGAIPRSRANWVTSAFVRKVCKVASNCLGIRVEAANAFASSSALFSNSLPVRNVSFLLCGRMCAASWKNENQR